MDANGSPFHRANKNRPGDWAVKRLLIGPALRRAFGGVYAYADPSSLALRGRPDLPVVVCSTHTGWWDGYMAPLVNRRVFGRDGYLMMEEVNLARYFFFTWGGVFGVDRDNPRKALASIEYSAQLLTEAPNRLVWMFPQGTITHPDRRPFMLFGGAAQVARKTGRCALVPVAMRYEFLMEQAPDAFVRVGLPIIVEGEAGRLSSRELTSRLQQAMTETDDALHADLIASNFGHYRRILLARGSSNRVWDGIFRVASAAKNTLFRH